MELSYFDIKLLTFTLGDALVYKGEAHSKEARYTEEPLEKNVFILEENSQKFRTIFRRLLVI